MIVSQTCAGHNSTAALHCMQIMTSTKWWLLFPLLLVGPFTKGTSVDNRFLLPQTEDEYLNMCLAMDHYKPVPSTQTDLLPEECGEWRDLSCCTHEKTTGYTEFKKYFGFNMSHCGKDLPRACMQLMQKEFCFTRCSPYLGPWMVKVQRRIFVLFAF